MRYFGAAALAIVLVVTSCTQQTTPPPAGGTGAASPDAQRGGRVVAGVGENFTSLSPVHGFDFISNAIWSKFYRPMLTEDPDTGELKGELAKEFALSADRLSITFKIRDGLVWSDGVAFTGEDYLFTAEALSRSKKSRFNQIFKDVVGFKDYVDGKADTISGITLSDQGKTITVKRAVPVCIGLRDLGLVPTAVLPKHQFGKTYNTKTMNAAENIDEHPMHNAPPVSIGPFVFKENRPGVEVTMTRNEKYWKGAPLIDEFIVKVYSGPQALKAALLTGEVTYATNVPANDVAEIRQAGRDLRFIRLVTPTDNNFIGWNKKSPTAPWLANKEVRQALSYGLNVDAALERVMQGFATRTFTHTAPVFWSYPKNGEGLNKYPYDPAKAKQLLEKAGATMGTDGVYRWTDGKPMVLKIDGVGGGAPPGLVIEIAQEQYKQIGITVQPNLLSFPAFVERTTGKAPDRDGTFWGFQPGGAEGEPVWPFYHSAGPANFWNYSNPEADKAIIAGREGPDCSMPARERAYHTFNKILNEDAANTYLWMRDMLAFAHNSLQGFEPKAFSLHSEWNIEKWSVKR